MPADKRLVNYIREYIDKYPLSKIEEKISSLGYSQYQIQLALNDLIYPPPPKRTKIILIAGVATLGILIFAISFLHFMDVSPAAGKKVSITALRPIAYKGGLGYTVLIPRDYSYISKPQDDSETVLVFPKETKPAEEERSYSETETIKIVASKKQGVSNFLENMRSDLAGRLKNQGAVFDIGKLDIRYPNFHIEISSPYLLVKTLLEGEHLVYTFTSGKDSEVFRFILKNLKDPKTLDLISGQVPKMGRRTPTGFITKKRFFIPLPDSLEGVSVANPYDYETEDIYFFPKTRQFEDVVMNAANIESGVIYVSVTAGDFNKQLDILRYETDYKNVLNETSARYTMEWLELPGAPALKITHSAPIGHIEIVVFAKTEVYRLWAREETEVLKGLYRYLQTRLKGPSV